MGLTTPSAMTLFCAEVRLLSHCLLTFNVLVMCTECVFLVLPSFNRSFIISVSHKTSLIRNCFQWQVESGKLVLEKAEFDLEAELVALIDVFSVQCDNKGLFISLQLAGQIIFVSFELLSFTRALVLKFEQFFVMHSM